MDSVDREFKHGDPVFVSVTVDGGDEMISTVFKKDGIIWVHQRAYNADGSAHYNDNKRRIRHLTDIEASIYWETRRIENETIELQGHINELCQGLDLEGLKRVVGFIGALG